MLDQETIGGKLELLAVLRRRLDYRIRQLRLLGIHARPDEVFDFEDAQAAINDLKAELRDASVEVADDPIDAASISSVPPVAHTSQEQRNRSRMLQKVRDFWVRGVLEQSLHGAALIALGLEPRPGAVVPPWERSAIGSGGRCDETA